MTVEDRQRLADLKALLAKRKNKPGWRESATAIEKAIAEIENGG